jgi:phospholipid-transporting ATPase
MESLIELNKQIKEEKIINKHNFSLIITGGSLSQISENEKQQQIFTEIINNCDTVIACRVTPKQKKEIVALVKTNNPTLRTLSIGDGANDVNMISEAHIGVGIKGLEGNQAARASDYAIGEFKLLRRLVLCHGRECYRKNSQIILYNFYKNILYLIPQFYFGVSEIF